MKKLLTVLIVTIVSASAFAGSAIRYEAFDGGWFGPNTWALIQYASHGAGNELYSNGDSVTHNADMEANMYVSRLATWQQIGKLSIHFSLIVPYGDVTVDSVGKASGLGDVDFLVTIKPLDWESGYLNFGVSTTIPAGTYSASSAMNMGNNRWAFDPHLKLGQTIGRFNIDLWAEMLFYTDNSDYAGGTLEKDLAFFSEVHFAYLINPEKVMFASLGLGGAWGGEEEVNGVKNNKMGDYAVKAAFGMNITEDIQLTISYRHDLHVENDIKANQFLARLMFVM